jgi:hypothetical protein
LGNGHIFSSTPRPRLQAQAGTNLWCIEYRLKAGFVGNFSSPPTGKQPSQKAKGPEDPI